MFCFRQLMVRDFFLRDSCFLLNCGATIPVSSTSQIAFWISLDWLRLDCSFCSFLFEFHKDILGKCIWERKMIKSNSFFLQILPRPNLYSTLRVLTIEFNSHYFSFVRFLFVEISGLFLFDPKDPTMTQK